jgi:hypothetical protein
MRLRSLFPAAALVALAFTSAARGADPIKVPPHQLCRLKADMLDAKAAILWRVTPREGVDRATTARDRLEFTAPPGTYTVERLVIRAAPDAAPEVEEAVFTVVFEGCSPVPPAPKPIDPPAPAPKPKPKANPFEALGRIQFGNAGCTASVMDPRLPDGRYLILTAEHCVSDIPVGGKGVMQLRSGATRFTVKVVAKDARSDVAWLVTERADLGDLPVAVLAAESAPKGTRVWHAGFGVDNPGNREDGEVTRADTGQGKAEMMLSVSSGDSGGGIFRADTGELISTVCCTVRRGAKVEMYGGNVESIRKLRPKPPAADTADWWTPAEVPEVTAPGVHRDEARDWWRPAELPACRPGPAVADVRR